MIRPKEIGKAKGSGDEELAKKLIDEVADLKEQIRSDEEAERRLNEEINDFSVLHSQYSFCQTYPKGRGKKKTSLCAPREKCAGI